MFYLRKAWCSECLKHYLPHFHKFHSPVKIEVLSGYAQREKLKGIQAFFSFNSSFQSESVVTSLVVQWLRLCLPMQRVQVRSLVWDLGSHMPRSQKTKTWNRNKVSQWCPLTSLWPNDPHSSRTGRVWSCPFSHRESQHRRPPQRGGMNSCLRSSPRADPAWAPTWDSDSRRLQTWVSCSFSLLFVMGLARHALWGKAWDSVILGFW